MQKSNAPTPYVIPWANSGTKNTIPVASQIGITNGAASYTDGFPPVTFLPIASGGTPPFGQDTNGILYTETLNTLWQQSGFKYAYNSTFSTNQGGYPAQSLLSRADGKGFWLSLADNNTTNPDATGAANWASVRANIGSTTIAVVNGTNTPDVSTLGPRLLIITGSISSSASLILPLTAGASWVIYNNTTGAGTLSVQGATGAGVTVAQGSTSEVITDGTNYYTSTFNGSGVYLPINGTAVAATKLATARTISITGDLSYTSPSFDGTANVSATGTISNGAVTLSKMAAFQANSLMGNPTGATATPSAITLASPLGFSGSQLVINPTSANVISWLGYTPVQQGTGVGQLTNVVKIGYKGSSKVGVTIDSTDLGNFALESWVSSNFAALSGATFTGNVTGTNFIASSFSSPGVNFIVGSTGAGTIYLRPNGISSTTGQTTVASSGLMTVNGNLVVTGTINYNTSDRTLKDNAVLFQARPLHRSAPMYSYRRWDIDEWSKGPMAQDIIYQEPLYGGEYDHVFDDGHTERKLGIDQTKIALEQAWWCGEQIDKIMLALKDRGIEVN